MPKNMKIQVTKKDSVKGNHKFLKNNVSKIAWQNLNLEVLVMVVPSGSLQ